MCSCTHALIVTPKSNLKSTKHERNVVFIRGDPQINWQDAFEVYGRPRNKTVRTLLRPKADNILPYLSSVMTNGIRVAPRVLLRDGGVNLNEDAESLKS